MAKRDERPNFSGKEEDFAYWSERFEAYAHCKKLKKVLNDEIALPEREADQGVYDTAKEKLDDDRFTLWCELVQSIDKRSLLLIKRDCKGNGLAAWTKLKEQYKSSARPRVMNLMGQFTSLKLASPESIADYLIRAEELCYDLEEAGETVSDSMLTSLVLKGLPREYESFVTVKNYSGGEVKLEFATLKKELLNYEMAQKPLANQEFSNSSFQKVQCHGCKQFGHKASVCRSRNVKCHNCNEMGHMAKYCSAPRKEGNVCEYCKRPGHDANRCYKKNPALRTTRPQANIVEEEHIDLFSFHADSTDEQSKKLDIIVDSGCTGYMFNNREIFTDFVETRNEYVRNADFSQTAILGHGTATIEARDAHGRCKTIEFRDASYVPSYPKNLISVKRLNDKHCKVIYR